VSINLYDLKSKLKIVLQKRIDSIDVNEHPFDYAWLTYAFYHDNIKENFLFKKTKERLEGWVLDKSGSKNRDLGALSICYFITSNEKIKAIIIKKAEEILERIIPTEISKFSILNDPVIVYCFVLALHKNFNTFEEKIVKTAHSSFKGNLIRKIFFLASLFELEKEFDDDFKFENPQDVNDKILILWFRGKYDTKKEQKLKTQYEFIPEIASEIDLELFNEKNVKQPLSNICLSLLFEYLNKELLYINPSVLFDYYPLHPEVKRIAYSYFANEKYIPAIFESIKKLIEFIRIKINIPKSEHSEVKIIKQTMTPKDHNGWKDAINIPILFNDRYVTGDISARNEQEGLALIAEGLIKAFRHPKGHKPEDDQLLQISPYDALDQLVIISYMWKRIERARIKSLMIKKKRS